MRKRKAVVVVDEVSAMELTRARPALYTVAAAAATKKRRRRSGGDSNKLPLSCVYQLRSGRGRVAIGPDNSSNKVCQDRNSRTRSSAEEPEACSSTSNGSSEVVMDGEKLVDLLEEQDEGKPATNEKMPTEAELEDFFAEAEKERTKRFIEKYNYDIVNDVPLEGRYQWTPIEPDHSSRKAPQKARRI